MKLTLDYTQRLNLHALMGAQRAALDDLRSFWKLQDLIDLTPEEKETINYRATQQNGQAMVQWDAGKALPLKEYDLSEPEFQRISKMVKEWQPGFLIGADRIWIEPLLAQLDAPPAASAAVVNGAVRQTIDPKINQPGHGLGSAATRL